MSRVFIADLDDSRLAVYRDLPNSNPTRNSGLFVAEGWLLVDRLLKSELTIASILLDERFEEELGAQLPSDVPIYVVPAKLVNDIVGFKFHRGVLACGRRPVDRTIAEALPPDKQRRLTVVVAADIHDPENMGCILRNSAAFGVDLVVASRRCADPFSRRVLRTSMGTVFRLPLVQPPQVMDAVRELMNDWRIELAATVLDDHAESLHHAVRGDRFGLVFGNEGHGLEADLAAACTRRLTIPMQGGTDSLNVGVATGIFLYHFCGPHK